MSRPTPHRMHNVYVHGSRKRSRRVYLFRIMYYGSVMNVLLWLVAFVASELYTVRPGFVQPTYRTGP